MSEYDDPLDDESPKTPKEKLHERVHLAARDAWLAMNELAGLRLDPEAAPFVEEELSRLSSVKTNAELILSHVSVSGPRLRAVS